MALTAVGATGGAAQTCEPYLVWCNYAKHYNGSITWTSTLTGGTETRQVSMTREITATVVNGQVSCAGGGDTREDDLDGGGLWKRFDATERVGGSGLLVVERHGSRGRGGVYTIEVACPRGEYRWTHTERDAGTSRGREPEEPLGRKDWQSGGEVGTDEQRTDDFEELRGSVEYEHPDSDPYNGLAGTVRVSWALTTRLTDEDVVVAIDGPRCVCLESEDPAGARLQFFARASVPGGSFSPFEVRTSGPAPREVVNQGGAAPRLELETTAGSEPLTLSIAYSRGGKSYVAEGVTVSFCVMDSISIGDGYRDRSFDTALPGRLEIPVSSKARVDGSDVSGELQWSLQDFGGGTTANPGAAVGSRALLAYEGLPDHNDAFGEKSVVVRVARGDCACQRDTRIRAFFPPMADNNPRNEWDDKGSWTPNWFHYWLQTSAAGSVDPRKVRYASYIPAENDPNEQVVGRYVWDGDRVLVSDLALAANGCRGRVDRATRKSTNQQATGFDCFAEILRHEWQHRTEELQWWRNTSHGYQVWLDGTDMDEVPIAVENQEPGCSTSSAYSCDGRPFKDVTDREIYAYYAGWTWRIGAADDEDWSCGGKQYRGATCPY